jgi:hypothetical protein
MADIHHLFRSLLPRHKICPSGWISFNAPCCHHRGHKHDTKKRGGVNFTNGIFYNCFNCKFTASWQPGNILSDKFKTLCLYLGAIPDEIADMILLSIKSEKIDSTEVSESIYFSEKSLPENALLISEWLQLPNELLIDIIGDLSNVLEYLINRGFDPLSKEFYWSPIKEYNDRVIVVFYYNKKIVGSASRRITNDTKSKRTKYIVDHHPHFVFNIDNQDYYKKYVFVTEGAFDALALDGVAVLTNNISPQQARIINNLRKQVIVVPDQDIAGLHLIEKAVEYNWYVAFPNWESSVKDPADAVRKYGRIFVLIDLIETAIQNELKIKMSKNELYLKLLREV